MGCGNFYHALTVYTYNHEREVQEVSLDDFAEGQDIESRYVIVSTLFRCGRDISSS